MKNKYCPQVIHFLLTKMMRWAIVTEYDFTISLDSAESVN